VPDHRRHGDVQAKNQNGLEPEPKRDAGGMELKVALRKDVENVDDFKQAEPEELTIAAAEEEEQRGTEPCKQANQAIHIVLRVLPEDLSKAMSLPFVDQAGITQLHWFLDASRLAPFPLGRVVPDADGEVQWLTGLREIGGNSECQVFAGKWDRVRRHGAERGDQPAVDEDLKVRSDGRNPKRERAGTRGQCHLEPVPREAGEKRIALRVPRLIPADQGPGRVVEGGVRPPRVGSSPG